MEFLRSLFATVFESLTEETVYRFLSISVIYFSISFVRGTLIIKTPLPLALLYHNSERVYDIISHRPLSHSDKLGGQYKSCIITGFIRLLYHSQNETSTKISLFFHYFSLLKNGNAAECDPDGRLIDATIIFWRLMMTASKCGHTA